jgi:hypothetical protein
MPGSRVSLLPHRAGETPLVLTAELAGGDVALTVEETRKAAIRTAEKCRAPTAERFRVETELSALCPSFIALLPQKPGVGLLVL